MTHTLVGPEVQLSERDDRARRAVKTFRSMQPTLSAYARILTGDPKVEVVMHTTSNGKTDGKKIYFRPPIEALSALRLATETIVPSPPSRATSL